MPFYTVSPRDNPAAAVDVLDMILHRQLGSSYYAPGCVLYDCLALRHH